MVGMVTCGLEFPCVRSDRVAWCWRSHEDSEGMAWNCHRGGQTECPRQSAEECQCAMAAMTLSRLPVMD